MSAQSNNESVQSRYYANCGIKAYIDRSNLTPSLNAYKDSDLHTRMDWPNIIWEHFLHFHNIEILNFLSIVSANAMNLTLSEHVTCALL